MDLVRTSLWNKELILERRSPGEFPPILFPMYYGRVILFAASFTTHLVITEQYNHRVQNGDIHARLGFMVATKGLTVVIVRMVEGLDSRNSVDDIYHAIQICGVDNEIEVRVRSLPDELRSRWICAHNNWARLHPEDVHIRLDV